MCKLCRKLICPPFCPDSREKEEAYGGEVCRNCGAVLREGELFYRSHGKPYCQTCIEEATPDDLVRFCETTWEDWLEEMGIEPVLSIPRVHVGGAYDV